MISSSFSQWLRSRGSHFQPTQLVPRTFPSKFKRKSASNDVAFHPPINYPYVKIPDSRHAPVKPHWTFRSQNPNVSFSSPCTGTFLFSRSVTLGKKITSVTSVPQGKKITSVTSVPQGKKIASVTSVPQGKKITSVTSVPQGKKITSVTYVPQGEKITSVTSVPQGKKITVISNLCTPG